MHFSSILTPGVILLRHALAISRRTCRGSWVGGNRTSSVALAVGGIEPGAVPDANDVTDRAPLVVARAAIGPWRWIRSIDPARMSASVGCAAAGGEESWDTMSAARSMAAVNSRVGSTTAPPKRPACTALMPTDSVIDRLNCPRCDTVTVGTPGAGHPRVGHQDAADPAPADLGADSVENGSQSGAADLLGAIDHDDDVTTAVRPTEHQASTATMWAMNWPLSSLAPRATSLVRATQGLER